MDFKDKLIQEYQMEYQLTDNPSNFLDWVIDKYETYHKKQVQMAGDLGRAYRRIGDLERQLYPKTYK